MTDVWTDCLLDDGRRVDITVDDGAITAVGPASRDRTVHDGPARQVHPMDGRLVLPSFAEPHAHIDKAFLAERVDNPTNDLMGAINGLEAARHTITEDDTHERAMRALRLMARNGISRVRTHADVMDANGLESVRALLRAKRDARGFIDVQVSMLLSWPVTGPEGASHRRLAVEAIEAGVDAVGGCPHLDSRPEEAVNWFVALAVEAGLPLDLHADENLREDSADLERLAERILSVGSPVRVTAGHCVSLSVLPASRQREIARKVAAAGISVVALPQTNLYLQARGHTTLAPRAITPVGLLLDHGVNVAAGGDNLQDPFNPLGRGDALETASLLVASAHVSVEEAARCVGRRAHVAIGARAGTIATGERADFVGIAADTVRESVAMGPPDRVVVYGGVAVADTTETESSH